MQAIILAAGMGKRLGELTKENTKCMIKVNGITLIDRTLEQFSCLNLNKIVIVIGYKGDKVKNHVGNNYKGTPIQYIYNPVYDKTNNIYSLSLAKDELEKDDTILIESDLIFEPTILDKILQDPSPNVALVAKYESWMDGTVVALDENNVITNFVSKKLMDFDRKEEYYKTVNIYKFSRSFSSTYYIPFLEAYIKAIGKNEYYEQVLRVIALLDMPELKALPLADEKWYEIDDAQDLNTAATIFADEDKKLSMMQKRYGGYWRFPSMLDYCYLVNPFFPTPRLMSEMKSNFETLLTNYPSGMQVNTLLSAKYFGLKSEYVCVGNGASELIKGLVEQIDGQAGMVFPTFEEYPNRLSPDRAVVFTPANADYSYTVTDLIQFFGNKSIEVLLLINPDNPSGNFLSQLDLMELLSWIRIKQIRLILDESFVDFSDATFTFLNDELLAEYPELIVVKSISKSYGVPGLRLGVLASGDTALINRIRKDIPIWNINSFAEFYMQIFNKYELEYKQACRRFVQERTRFLADLQEIDFLRIIPSQANYFLCEVIHKYTSKELTQLLLTRHNILIKDCSSKKAFRRSQYIRIAIRSTADNQAFVAALKTLT
jgi:histidinol-phosphate/aromatic aminotransferase/cobyric acid decarboxylase-like protein/choline kinase